MVKLKGIGHFEVLPEMAQHIVDGNSEAVQAAIAGGWKIRQPIKLSQYTELTPLHMALVTGQLEIVKLLVEHGVPLNDQGCQAFLVAVRYCDEATVRYLVEKGAKLDGLNRVKSSAYDEAYYGNKQNIALVHELGLDIRKYGGKTLRRAVSDRDLKTVEYLLKHGVDINYNEPDMVYPYRATPLTVAARNNDFSMVKYLVEHGADVTIAEKDGERAYSIAAINRNEAMTAYLKALEPPEFHNLSNKMLALKSYKLPPDLITFLSGDHRRVEIPENEYEMRYVDFLGLVDTIEMKVGRQKLLRLSAEVDQYSELYIVWSPSKKSIGCYDGEHLEYTNLGKFADFLADPKRFVGVMFGEAE
ncbi:hypothetical protein GRF59_00730 [Paenibacillus sp. HJL G12]|uniref:Ankyrin repeat domain-containing protein n=1 Tax=Paenibacillus dendrobii TaxID=2691084 RepID=A0A7X3LEM4_9BACL|nr:ankyrin repeat domain-containing protein [Paenibacillus dendrobii]MWV42142.1 hypothetical protein [Paenibacillus dendrobii]